MSDDELIGLELPEETWLSISEKASRENITHSHAIERLTYGVMIRQLEDDNEKLKAVIRKRTDKIDRLKVHNRQLREALEDWNQVADEVHQINRHDTEDLLGKIEVLQNDIGFYQTSLGTRDAIIGEQRQKITSLVEEVYALKYGLPDQLYVSRTDEHIYPDFPG